MLARRDEIELLKSSRKNDEQADFGFVNDDALFDTSSGFEFEDVPEHGK